MTGRDRVEQEQFPHTNPHSCACPSKRRAMIAARCNLNAVYISCIAADTPAPGGWGRKDAGYRGVRPAPPAIPDGGGADAGATGGTGALERAGAGILGTGDAPTLSRYATPPRRCPRPHAGAARRVHGRGAGRSCDARHARNSRNTPRTHTMAHSAPRQDCPSRRHRSSGGRRWWRRSSRSSIGRRSGC